MKPAAAYDYDRQVWVEGQEAVDLVRRQLADSLALFEGNHSPSSGHGDLATQRDDSVTAVDWASPNSGAADAYRRDRRAYLHFRARFPFNPKVNGTRSGRLVCPYGKREPVRQDAQHNERTVHTRRLPARQRF